MRRMVPETQAVLRGRINSNPSQDTRVTYSDCEESMVKSVVAGSWPRWRAEAFLTFVRWSVLKMRDLILDCFDAFFYFSQQHMIQI
jgi:hypothetical protein